MTKKLLKYGKIVMALTLIGALTLPSYATVGAADGSAFVTKAEFDAALSDFNARLTTFEAGINSKIDSQVSSYLDRNGIWNGKEQELYMNFLKRYDSSVTFYPGSTLGQAWWCSPTPWVNTSTDIRTRGWGTKTDWASHTSLVYPTGTKYIEVAPPIKIVDNVSKSGLAVVYIQSGYQDLKTNGNTNYVNWGTTQVLGLLQNVPLVHDNLRGGNDINADDLANLREAKSTVSTFLCAQTNNGVQSGYNTGIQHIADGLATITVFVNKDKPLYSMFWWYMNCNGGYITTADFRCPDNHSLGITSSSFNNIDIAKTKEGISYTWRVKQIIVY